MMLGSLNTYWRYARNVLTEQGPCALGRLLMRKLRRIRGRYYPGYYDFDYARWRQLNPDHSTPDALQQRPLASILVPIYNVEIRWLRAMLDSVLAQQYEHWQLCLVNDAASDPRIPELLDQYAAGDNRIQVQHQTTNGGIAAASAAALSMSRGEWITLLDHDDLLAPDALHELLLAAERQPGCDFFYSDEDKVDSSGRYSNPFFKPDFSPELLQCQNYIGHLIMARRSLVLAVGGFQPGYDGAQDYDLVLRATAQASGVGHVPRVLYHWRQIPGSTSLLYGEKDYAWEAGRKAIENHLTRTYPGAMVDKGPLPGTYRPSFSIIGTPMISLIIPFRDRPELLDQCLESLIRTTRWPALEIIAINNQSQQEATLATMDRWQQRDSRIRFIDHDQPFNFAAICNQGVEAAEGEYIVLLNNDIEFTEAGWLENLLQYAQQPDIGAVGAMLAYPDGRVQHAGIVLGIGGSAGHGFKYFAPDQAGYFGRLKISSNVSAVSAALLMVSKEKYLAVGGMNQTDFSIALNDVDLCLELQQAGYRNLVTSGVRAIHHESVSRGDDLSGESRDRLQRESAAFQLKWQGLLTKGDRWYNPNLTLESEDYRLRFNQL